MGENESNFVNRYTLVILGQNESKLKYVKIGE